MALPTQADLLGFDWGVGGVAFMDLAATSSLDTGAPEWNLGGLPLLFAATSAEDPAAPRAVTAVRQYALLGNPSVAEADLTALRTLVLRTSAQEDAQRRVTAARVMALRTFDDPSAPRRVTAVRQMVLRTNRRGGVAQVSAGFNVVMQPALPYERDERSPLGHYMVEAPYFNWAWNDLTCAKLITSPFSDKVAAATGFIGNPDILRVTVPYPPEYTPPDWEAPFTSVFYPQYSYCGAWGVAEWLYAKYPKGGLVPRPGGWVSDPVYPVTVSTYRWGLDPSVNPTYERRVVYASGANASSTSYNPGTGAAIGWDPYDVDSPGTPRTEGGGALGGLSESSGVTSLVLGLRTPAELPSWALKLEVPRARLTRMMEVNQAVYSTPPIGPPPDFTSHPNGNQWTTTGGNSTIGYAPTINIVRHPGRGRWRIIPGTLQGFRADPGTFGHLCYPALGINVAIPAALQTLCDSGTIFNSIEELADALAASGWDVNSDLLNLEGYNVLINQNPNLNIASQPVSGNGNAKWGHWMAPENNYGWGANGYGYTQFGPYSETVGPSGFISQPRRDLTRYSRYWTRTLVKAIFPYTGYFNNPVDAQHQYRLMNFGVGDFENPAGTYGIYVPPSLTIEKLDSPSAYNEAPIGYQDVLDP